MFVFKFVIILHLLLTVTPNHRISKRTLLFPQNTILQFTYGLSVPLILPKRSINLSVCAQQNYETPFNTTQLGPKIIRARSQGTIHNYDLSRNTFYDYVAATLDAVGLKGKTCLLRTICEVAEIPMDVENSNSLIENIVHYIFTPSEDYTSEMFQNYSFVIDNKYLQAEQLGKRNSKCYKQYPGCSISLVNLFTKTYYVI